jgi:hypothetical protein
MVSDCSWMATGNYRIAVIKRKTLIAPRVFDPTDKLVDPANVILLLSPDPMNPGASVYK